jgi:peptidoglycan L-alanyl-D-glutamate endopeptidase CwlK
MAIVDQYIPLQVLEGHRGQVAQDLAFEQGKSKVKWPNGKHNADPSLAVDVMPLPIDWGDMKRLHYFAGFVMAIAKSKGINLRWGGDWDGDTILGEPNDDWDKPHFELKLN